MARLLIMEDDVEFSLKLKRDLRRAGHEVEVRKSASDAITELQQTTYDVLISDIIVYSSGRPIPDGGIRLVGWVRANAETRDMPIVVMTGTHTKPGMSELLNIARSVGANIALEKPFLIEKLLNIIDDLHPGQSKARPAATE